MNWSLSKWNLYRKCAAQYKFRYIDKLPYEKSISASRGTELHAAIEYFLTGQLAELPPEINFYTQFLTNLKSTPEYALKPEYQLALDSDWKPVPWGEGNWCRMVIDLHVTHPTGITLYDWKSGREYDDHVDQRELYSLGALAHHPDVNEISAVHVYLDSKVNRETKYHRDNSEELKKKWNDRVALMQSDQDFIPYPGYHCRWCSYSRAKGGPCRF